jgi:uncharacterized phiE125 gp8 family phage protein
MTLFQTIGPEVEPVTLVEAKQNLRIDHDSEDSLLGALITAARAEIEASCGLALIEQSWRLTLDALPPTGRILLRRHPVIAVSSVTVYGDGGEASVVDPSSYQLDPLSRPSRLHVDAIVQPGLVMNGIEIDFTAGFGESGADVPDLLKRALLLLVAHWYEFRASYGAADQPVSYPPGYDRLIAAYRSRRL